MAGMFRLLKDDIHLSFTIERDEIRFGDGSRVVFWIDREQGGLQRGRQEFIPIDSITRFELDEGARTLICRLGTAAMVLHEGSIDEIDDLRLAVRELNHFCGINC